MSKLKTLLLCVVALAVVSLSRIEGNCVAQQTSEPEAGVLLTLGINGVDVNFHWAPAGTFMMGSPEDEVDRLSWEVQHEVELTNGFWIAETETTQELWEAVMGDNPSQFKGSNQLPVEKVSWNDCQDFVNKLASAYSSALPAGYKYALPTEAQWEYACRAGSTTPFSFGSTFNIDKANCNGNSSNVGNKKVTYKEQTTPVRSYSANAWGLYDMHGNVYEWTSDLYGEKYYTNSSATTDPTGARIGSYRVLRGGCWRYDASDSRSANRSRHASNTRNNSVGFRLVLVPSK